MASDGVGQATLGWTDNSNNEDGFKIERKPASEMDTAFTQINTVPANPPQLHRLAADGGELQLSGAVLQLGGELGLQQPGQCRGHRALGADPPSNLSATIGGGNTANLTWTDNSSNETGFLIERRVGTEAYSALVTKAVNATSHSDPSLTPETYTYRVIATGSPNSAPSNEVMVVIRNPEADAHVRDGTHADNNFGGNTTMEVKNNTTVGNNRQAYVRVNLADVQAT